MPSGKRKTQIRIGPVDDVVLGATAEKGRGGERLGEAIAAIAPTRKTRLHGGIDDGGHESRGCLVLGIPADAVVN